MIFDSTVKRLGTNPWSRTIDVHCNADQIRVFDGNHKRFQMISNSCNMISNILLQPIQTNPKPGATTYPELQHEHDLEMLNYSFQKSRNEKAK